MARIGSVVFCVWLGCALAGCGGAPEADKDAAPAGAAATEAATTTATAEAPASAADFELQPAEGMTILHRIDYPQENLGEPGIVSAFGQAPESMSTLACSVGGRTGSVTLYRFADAPTAARAFATAKAKEGTSKATFRGKGRIIVGIVGPATEDLLAVVEKQMTGR